MKDRQKQPVHYGKDHVQRMQMENERTQSVASTRQAAGTKDLVAIAERAEKRAIRSEKKSKRAWIMAIVSLIIAGSSLLVNVAGLFREAG